MGYGECFGEVLFKETIFVSDRDFLNNRGKKRSFTICIRRRV